MFSDPALRPINPNAYDDRPFSFLDQAAQSDLANISAINLIENGDRKARETWQNRQLTNLLRHAHARSGFWRKRLPTRMIGHAMMKYVPIQSRADVATQVDLEGSLVPTDGTAPLQSYASTGSTGTPVKVYVTPDNGYYNSIRSIAQYFVNDLSLAEDRLQIVPAISMAKLEQKSLSVNVVGSWAGSLSNIFKNGSAKKIVHQYDDDAMMAELSKSKAGYLVCPNRYAEILLKKGGIDILKNLGIKVWLHMNDYREPHIVETLKAAGIRSFSNYSSGETGPIAFECAKREGYFHVAHTNVIVESDPGLTASYNGASLGRLLITHLHSYATPIIRYDIGDFGLLEDRCPCGHDGPTLSNIFGRGKHFLRHPDGRLLPFYLSTRMLEEILPFKEFRVRQNEINTIRIEIGGRETLTADEEANLRKLVVKASDSEFNIEIVPVTEIDWSANPKRLFFTSSVA